MSIETDVLTLGSGKLNAHRIGPRASYLDKARVNKLPVPPGVIISEELIRECYSSYGSSRKGSKSSAEQNVRLVREDFLRDRLLTALPLLFQDSQWKHDFSVNEGRIKVAIRPAFSFDDGGNEPPPAMFHTELNVDSSSAILILESIKSVLASAHSYQNIMYAEELAQSEDSLLKGHNLRRDVLIMPMVNSQYSGLAFLQHDYEDDVALFKKGHALEITQGKEKGEKAYLPRLRFIEYKNKTNLPDFQKRLQVLIKKVRRVFGDNRDLEIEWADDGKQVWLLQVRYLSRKVERKEIMSALLHKEFFASSASCLSAELIEEGANKAFSFLKILHPSIPARRVFVKSINNQICINVSLLYDVCRIMGLPSSIVDDYLLPPIWKKNNKIAANYRINFFRILMKLPVFWTIFRFRLNLKKSTQELITKKMPEDMAPPGIPETLQFIAKLFSEGFRLVLLIQFALILPSRILKKIKLLDITLQRRQNLFRDTINGATKSLLSDEPEEVKFKKLLEQLLLPTWDLAQIGKRTYSSPINSYTLDLRHEKKKFKDFSTAIIYLLFSPIRCIINSLLGYREKISVFLQSQLRIVHFNILQVVDQNENIWNCGFNALLSVDSKDMVMKSEINSSKLLPILFEFNPLQVKINRIDSVLTENQKLIPAKIISDLHESEFKKIELIYISQDSNAVSDKFYFGIHEPSIAEWNNINQNAKIILDAVAPLSKTSFDARMHGFFLINVENLSLLESSEVYMMQGKDEPLKLVRAVSKKETIHKKKINKTIQTKRKVSKKKNIKKA